MKFAINYSHPAVTLFDEGRIQIDRLKTPNWPHFISEASLHSPVNVHFDLQAGQGTAAETDWDMVGRLLEQTFTPYVNLHLSPSMINYPDIISDRPTPAQAEHVIDQMLRDVMLAVQRFGPERVIVENVPYRGSAGKRIRTAVEPEVIQRIVQETGCGLLLDISHARIAARSLGIDELDYMNSLPVSRLRELHFTGLHWLDGRWQDHLPVLEEDWPVLEWVIGQIRSGQWAKPWILCFEYGGIGGLFEKRSDPAVIAEQAPRLCDMVKLI
jgi:uncharacterized protein (UPF0276 family)